MEKVIISRSKVKMTLHCTGPTLVDNLLHNCYNNFITIPEILVVVVKRFDNITLGWRWITPNSVILPHSTPD